MKLRNKKTGKIVDRVDITIREEGVVFNNDETYNSLTELNAEWEDHEEPKDHWYITFEGVVYDLNPKSLPEYIRNAKSIGNYFETKEEAEKAVEKLKAWKRLKDNGFEFDGIILEGSNCLIKTKLKDNTGVTFDHAQQFYEDVNLLFGGEE